MTLRLMVIVLLLANAMFWVWSRDSGPGSGAAPGPAPVAQQVRPEALAVRSLADVVVPATVAGSGAPVPGQPPADAGASPAPAVSTLPLPEPEPEPAPEPELEPGLGPLVQEATGDEPATDPVDAAPAPAPPAPEPVAEEPQAPAPPVCWQAGPFNAVQAQQLREAAAALPAGSWQLRQTSDQAPRWMVYLGDMEDELAVLAKRSELQARGLDVDRAGAGFEPGLSLGRYSSREAADRALQMLSSQAGVSGARVVQERSEEATYFLRAESSVADWRMRLQALPLAGRTLRRCG